MLIAACQFDIAWEDPAANYARVRQMLRKAVLPAGTLVALPELFATGFSMNVAAICQESMESVASLAREFDICLVAGVASRAADGHGLNQAVVIGPEGTELARYTKIHCFPPGGENQHFAAGGELALFDWRDCKVAPSVCYDLRFPEEFGMAAARGAQLLVVIANWPASRQMHWRTLLMARAIENQAYVLGVNRCGEDPNVSYAGGSMIVDPRGNLIAEAGAEPCLIQAEIDPENVTRYRADFPGGSDRWVRRITSR